MYFDGTYTYTEASYSTCIWSLTRMRGAETVLRESADTLSGATRTCAVIALALRGDEDVKPRLLAILGDPETTGQTRALAVRGLGSVGDEGDIALLTRIEASDPFSREVTVHRRTPDTPESGVRLSYPVRAAAIAAIKEIRERAEASVTSE